ncbi:MAG: voltage-gated potassium channel [Candidatus Azotimanducaceae bacterium]|jgi:voltage-gated potassium channel
MALTMRARLYELVDSNQPGNTLGVWFDRFLIVLILTNVAAAVIETVEQVAIAYPGFFYAFELFSVAVFSAEYLLRIWTVVESPNSRFQHPVSGRLKYVVTPMSLIDLVAILPFYLSFFIGVDLRFMRVFRLFRLLKLTRFFNAMHTLGSALYLQRRAFLAALMIVLIMLVFSSSVIYLLEKEAQPVAFGSIPAAMWWGLATLTTVGYGDVYPITLSGRIFGSFVMVLGVCMFALPAGILATGFANEIRKREFIATWKMVARVPFFAFLDAHKISNIAELLELERVPAEFRIITKGERANAIYFISIGEVEVELPTGTVRVGAGDFFGEIALLKDCLRTANVTSVSQCQLMVLSVKDFQALLVANPDIRDSLNDIMESRLKELEATG